MRVSSEARSTRNRPLLQRDHSGQIALERAVDRLLRKVAGNQRRDIG